MFNRGRLREMRSKAVLVQEVLKMLMVRIPRKVAFLISRDGYKQVCVSGVLFRDSHS